MSQFELKEVSHSRKLETHFHPIETTFFDVLLHVACKKKNSCSQSQITNNFIMNATPLLSVVFQLTVQLTKNIKCNIFCEVHCITLWLWILHAGFLWLLAVFSNTNYCSKHCTKWLWWIAQTTFSYFNATLMIWISAWIKNFNCFSIYVSFSFHVHCYWSFDTLINRHISISSTLYIK